jgi:hypothetical protein
MPHIRCCRCTGLFGTKDGSAPISSACFGNFKRFCNEDNFFSLSWQ